MLTPIAAISVHWLDADDVIRATNGPACFMYRYISQWFQPFTMPKYVDEVRNLDEKAILRIHVASVYLSSKQHGKFLYYSYPAIYNSLPDGSSGNRSRAP